MKSISRRDLLKKTSISLLGGSFLLAGAEEESLARSLEENRPAGQIPGQALPGGKLGNIELSRMILGGNLIGGWAHARDLLYVSKLFKAYNTRERIIETLRLSEENGINCVLVTPTEMPLIREYNRDFNGNMKTMCQVRAPSPKRPYEEIDAAFEQGADTMYIMGAYADRLVQGGKMDLLVDLLDRIRLTGCPGGVGGHALTVIKECERIGVEADYYVKTLHPDKYWSAHSMENREEFEVDNKRYQDHDKFHDNIFDLYPDETISFMSTVTKPWVAFKVMAAGAVHPREAFKFAYENGADFIAAGMFDFQLREDVGYALKALESAKDRSRVWYG